MKDGKIESVSMMSMDYSDLEKRITALGISPGMLSASNSHSQPSYAHEYAERHRAWLALMTQRLNNLMASMLCSYLPLKRRTAVARPTPRVSGARNRKRVLQARYTYDRSPDEWVWSDIKTERRTHVHPQHSQISKSPTGRLNVSGPNRPDSWRKPSALAETVRKLREMWK